MPGPFVFNPNPALSIIKPPARSSTVPTAIAVSPVAIAAIQPLAQAAFGGHTQVPHEGLHIQADHHDIVAVSTDLGLTMLVLVVVCIGRRWLTWCIDSDGRVASTPKQLD